MGKSKTIYLDEEAGAAAREVAGQKRRSLSWAIRYLIALGWRAWQKGDRLDDR